MEWNQKEYSAIWILQGRILAKYKKKYLYVDNVTAPVEKGAEVGYISYSLGGAELGRTPIVASEAVEKAYFIDYLKKILIKYLI